MWQSSLVASWRQQFRQLRKQLLAIRIKLARNCLRPRLLVAASFLSAASSLAAISQLWLWLVPLLSFTFAFGILAKRRGLTPLFTLVIILSYCIASLRMPHPAINDLANLAPQKHLTFTGTIQEVNDNDEHKKLIVKCEKLLFPKQGNLSGFVLVTTKTMPNNIAEGKQVLIKGSLQKPETPRYEWEFNNSDYLKRRSVFSIAQARSITILENNQSLITSSFFLDSARKQIVTLHRQQIGEKDGDLLSSIVLGDKAIKLDANLVKQFRDAGLSHILAASGFNLTVVIGMTFWFCRLLLRSTWLTSLICLGTTVFYVGLAGTAPSVIRAALMCSIVLWSRARFRNLYPPACLSLALMLTTLYDPMSLLDIGFQLSYFATAGIIYGARTLTDLLRELMAMRLPNWLWQSIALVVCAQASVLPIQLFYFWQLGIFFLPANLIAAPLVEIPTFLGFASSLIALSGPLVPILSPLAWLLDNIANWPLKLMTSLVSLIASWDFSTIRVGHPLLISVCLYYLAAIIFLWSLTSRKQRAYCFLPFLICVLALFWHNSTATITVGCFPNALVVIDTNNQAYVMGKSSSRTVEKFLSYSGASLSKERAEKVNLIKQVNKQVTIVNNNDNSLAIVSAPFHTEAEQWSKVISQIARESHCRCILILGSPFRKFRNRESDLSFSLASLFPENTKVLTSNDRGPTIVTCSESGWGLAK